MRIRDDPGLRRAIHQRSAESQRAVCWDLSGADDFDLKRSGFLREHSLKLGDLLDVVSPRPNLHAESAEALP
jgi:hypothetical protein